jgi:hypothetical protein
MFAASSKGQKKRKREWQRELLKGCTNEAFTENPKKALTV